MRHGNRRAFPAVSSLEGRAEITRMTEATLTRTGATRDRRLHPAVVRGMHWVNAAAMLVMIGSGWTIYNDQPLFSHIAFPQSLALGGFPPTAYKLHGDGGFGGALLWHFAAMWVLVFNGLAYLGYGFATGRFRRMLLPITLRDTVTTIRETLRFHLAHEDLTIYNSVQKMLYIGVMALVVVQVLAGVALWKPVQFAWLTALFGGFQGARLAHFLGMAGICGFLLIHVALSVLVPRTLVNMVTGGPRVVSRQTSATMGEKA
jgi:thiosulfate reductase cytochrome b subunit